MRSLENTRYVCYTAVASPIHNALSPLARRPRSRLGPRRTARAQRVLSRPVSLGRTAFGLAVGLPQSETALPTNTRARTANISYVTRTHTHSHRRPRSLGCSRATRSNNREIVAEPSNSFRMRRRARVRVRETEASVHVCMCMACVMHGLSYK